MFKETPNPPQNDDVSPYESLNSKKLHDAADNVAITKPAPHS
ncbi:MULTISPECIES: hypothetical protein [unclassified Pseudomonas]|nr:MULTISPECIES: hypothetical protein [unclassified Pseudomonas]TWC20730.1 hypothetical protein FBY05_109120 [Pseudomonas sp. SJZ083]TWC47425.1 hypothetical protein FBY01_109120 [Pseudomonas sp. SJZ077]